MSTCRVKPDWQPKATFHAIASVLALALALGQGALAQTARAVDDEVKVKGAFDADDGVNRETNPDTPAGAVAKKGYSPYADRKFPTHVYYGDTHHHTANSGDAFMAGDRLTPEQSYRFARGEQVISSTGVPAKLSRPLDFLVVSDHAEGTAYDAVRFGIKMPPEVPMKHQERAWTSPVWYTPS